VGGTVPFKLLFSYIHFGTMTIPALDQYLAIGKSIPIIEREENKGSFRERADGRLRDGFSPSRSGFSQVSPTTFKHHRAVLREDVIGDIDIQNKEET
jgi:hypothetical protein